MGEGHTARPADPRRIGGPIRPRTARVLVAGANVLALVIAFLPRSPARPPPSPPQIAVSYVFSSDAATLLMPLIDQFNQQGRILHGKRITVAPASLASGRAEADIRNGRLQPVAWTPASSAWGRLLNTHLKETVATELGVSLVQSPQVIAMWEQLAEALGVGERPVGWKDVLSLAASDRGWAERGRPEFGRFKLGHTNPNISTSGLMAAVSEYYAILGERSGLKKSQLGIPEVRSKVRDIERSIVHYGDTADRFLERMDRYGADFAHAIYVQETSLVRFNAGRPLGHRLIGIYPAEGTFVADYPFLVMRAEWVSEDQAAAAMELLTWLDRTITAERATESAFRLNDRALPPIDTDHGADPNQPRGRILEVPSGDVLAAAQDAWNENRKRATIMVAVDTSGSMGESGKMLEVKQALPPCLNELVSDDRVGLISFGDEVSTEVRLDRYDRNRDKLRQEIDDLFPAGRTALYDATKVAATMVAAEGADDRIEAVVVLTDGKDDVSDATLESLLDYLESLTEQGTPVLVFAVVYGSDADRAALQQIVDASRGQLFTAGQTEVPKVCAEIFSFF